VRVGTGSVSATVKSVFYTGDAYELLVDVGGDTELTVTVDRSRSFSPGDIVSLAIDDAHVVE
jgi:TOBE domain.